MALITNIVSYWKLDEASGNAADATATANTLTNTNVTYSATHAIINNAANFNGTTSKLVAGSNWYPGSGDFSISLWFYCTNTASGVAPALLTQWDDVATNQRSIAFTINGGNVTYQSSSDGSNNAAALSGGTTISNNTLYHAVLTKTGTTQIVIYLNGIQDGIKTTGITAGIFNSTASLGVGWAQGFGGGSPEFFPGTIDEVGTWNRALSSAEVTQLYNSGAGLQYPFTGAGTVLPYRALLGVGI